MACGYRSDLPTFLTESDSNVLSQLVEFVSREGFKELALDQIPVWKEEVALLRRLAKQLMLETEEARSWSFLLEFVLPRWNTRPDVVLIAHDALFVLELKCGAKSFDSAAKRQTCGYALDLRDFHSESDNVPIVPMLIATNANESLFASEETGSSGPLWGIECLRPRDLSDRVVRIWEKAHDPKAKPIDPVRWDAGTYRPTSNIIESAQRLYETHSVLEIKRAWAENLESTTDFLKQIIGRAQREHFKAICFVTGVPGAGKTLTGLQAVHTEDVHPDPGKSKVFLSGNGPLVKIIGQALRNNIKANNPSLTREELTQEVGRFIQNVHHFLRDHLDRSPEQIPEEQLVVFDEAQRAWDAEHIQRKWGRRWGIPFNASEPELLMRIMSRHKDWCVIIALVGGGQEIYKGEAGLSEWGRALTQMPEGWVVYVSPDVLEGGTSVAGQRLFEDTTLPKNLRVLPEEKLHLKLSVRSLRALHLNDWVNHLLDGNPGAAKLALSRCAGSPLFLTRKLEAAREWLREEWKTKRINEHQRYGLIASSGAIRLRAYGLEVSRGFRNAFPFESWFLSPKDNVNSSYQLEVALTEFECQGLELDWVGVCWGGDLYVDEALAHWSHRKFRGAKWQRIHNPLEQQYLTNVYRVLLTRAREGMIIWVPEGRSDDPNLEPAEFDAIASYLENAGVGHL